MTIDEIYERTEIVACQSGIDINIFIGGNDIDNLAEGKNICHRLTARDYNFGNIERIIVTEKVLNSIYYTFEAWAIFGILFFAFAKRAIVGAVKRHHNGEGKIVAT